METVRLRAYAASIQQLRLNVLIAIVCVMAILLVVQPRNAWANFVVQPWIESDVTEIPDSGGRKFYFDPFNGESQSLNLSVDNGSLVFAGRDDQFITAGLYKTSDVATIDRIFDETTVGPLGSTGLYSENYQYREGNVAFAGNIGGGTQGVALWDGTNFSTIAQFGDVVSPYNLQGFSQPSPNADGVVSFLATDSGFRNNVYLNDGTNTTAIGDRNYSPSSGTMSGGSVIYYQPTPSFDPQIVKYTPGTGNQVMADITTPVIGRGTTIEDVQTPLSVRTDRAVFVGFESDGKQGVYQILDGSNMVSPFVTTLVQGPSGSNFTYFEEVAVGEEGNVLFTAQEGGNTALYLRLAVDATPPQRVIGVGDEIDGRTVTSVNVTKDSFDGEIGAFYVSFDNEKADIYQIEVSSGLPTRGFLAASSIVHTDSGFVRGISAPQVQNITEIEETIDSPTFARSSRTLSPVYLLGPPAAGDAPVTIADNYARTEVEAFEETVPFFPGAVGPVVKARSYAQLMEAYRGDLGDADLARSEVFDEVKATGKAVSYYRAAGTPGETVPVNISGAFTGIITLADPQSFNGLFVEPEASVSLKLSVHANGQNVVLFNGAVEFESAGVFDLLDFDIREPISQSIEISEFGDTFFFREISSPTGTAYEVQVSLVRDDVFGDDTVVQVGDLIALSVELTTNVWDVRGRSFFDEPETFKGYAETVFANSNFFSTFEGVAYSNEPGQSLVLIPEPASLSLLALGGLALLRRTTA